MFKIISCLFQNNNQIQRRGYVCGVSLISRRAREIKDGNIQCDRKSYSNECSGAIDNCYEEKDKKPRCTQFDRKVERYKPVTHVIFGLDGLLLDTEDQKILASRSYLKSRFKKKYDMEMHGLVMGMRDVDAAKFIVKTFRLPVSADVFMHGVWQELMSTFRNAHELPGASVLVRHLARCKIPMALATSSTEKTFRIKAKCHKGWINKFCPMVFAGDEMKIKRGKPHPDTFHLAISRFPVPPESIDKVLVIEDSLNGIKAANEAGMQSVMVPHRCLPTHFVESAEPTLLLKDLFAFKPELFKLPPFPVIEK